MATSRAVDLDRFQSSVDVSGRISVTELSRGKDWRGRLSSAGCFEIVDRNGTVGFVLSPDYAAALSDQIDALRDELERAEVEAVFRRRASYGPAVGGDELANGARDLFEENEDAVMRFLGDGE